MEENLVLQNYFEKPFQKNGLIQFEETAIYAGQLIEKYDVRSGQGKSTLVRSMSGGNQQKAIIAREMERKHNLLIAVQPTRGLDVGAVEYIHGQLISERNHGNAVLLVSFELSEVLGISDRILVMHRGEIVGELLPGKTSEEELGLYMSGVKKREARIHE